MIGNGIPEGVTLERDQGAMPCPCGGYCNKVDCIVKRGPRATGRRITRRIAGKLTGCLLGKLFR